MPSILRFGEELQQDQFLESDNGLFRAVLQSDGNFVLLKYSISEKRAVPMWDSGTAFFGGSARVYIDKIVDSSSSNRVQIRIENYNQSDYRVRLPAIGRRVPFEPELALQSDGNLVLKWNANVPANATDTFPSFSKLTIPFADRLVISGELPPDGRDGNKSLYNDTGVRCVVVDRDERVAVIQPGGTQPLIALDGRINIEPKSYNLTPDGTLQDGDVRPPRDFGPDDIFIPVSGRSAIGAAAFKSPC